MKGKIFQNGRSYFWMANVCVCGKFVFLSTSLWEIAPCEIWMCVPAVTFYTAQNRACLLKMPAVLQMAQVSQYSGLLFLYVIVYNFTWFRCAENRTLQEFWEVWRCVITHARLKRQGLQYLIVEVFALRICYLLISSNWNASLRNTPSMIIWNSTTLN